jgi:hypothetical protein
MPRPRIALLAAVAALVALPRVAPAQLPSFKTDHFKCYPIERSGDVNEFVVLRDQFDLALPNGAEDQALVAAAALFCNPTAKTEPTGAVSAIVDPDNHLTLYRIASTPLQTPGATAVAPPGAWIVQVQNQLGDQRLRVGPAVLLAVPTQKRPHEAPSGLDHFKCYVARGVPFDPPREVSLQDQFDEQPESARVLRPVLFCNPTLKRHDDRVAQVQNPEEHLTCYGYLGTAAPSPRRRVGARNQLSQEQFRVKAPRVLCVPSLKTDFSFVPALP